MLRKGKLFPFASPYSVVGSRESSQGIMAISTGEFRIPKKGEYFLSGDPIEAYKADNDLTWEYNIAVAVRTEKVIKVVEYL